MRECIFCRIVAGDAPASYVYEDEQLVAFMDTRPVNQGHTLVVPRAHAERIANLDTSTGGHLFAVAMSLSQAVQRAVGSDGINLQLADGEAAGQEISHFHLHIIPRFRGDRFRLRVRRWRPARPSREELDQLAEVIKTASA